jgi:hypothetical protein
MTRGGRMKKFVRDNSLSLVMFLLFFLTLGVGQTLTGQREYNNDQLAHDGQALSFLEYLRSGHFREATFENWESEFLQMAAYVFLTAFLIQRGSAESKKPEDEGESPQDVDPRSVRAEADTPWAVHKGGVVLRLYENSLGIFFALAFLGSFLMHANGGAVEYNSEQAEHGEPANYTTWSYMGTARFWFESFQNWQSEFLAVLAIVLASVWLRQRGSPESKPVHEPHYVTNA